MFGKPRNSSSMSLEDSVDGNKCPTMWNGKAFRFISQPSREHLKKIKDHKSMDCSILKFFSVLHPGYGPMVLTVCTSGSFNKREVYEVSISNFPSCSSPDLKFMKVRANRKWKLMPCKHLYYLLQEHFSCTKDDVFIHCLRWTPN